MEKQILTVKETASFLDISTDQLYKLNAAGRIPSHRPTGGKIYYIKDEIIEWVRSGRRATKTEIQSQAIKSLTPKN